MSVLVMIGVIIRRVGIVVIILTISHSKLQFPNTAGRKGNPKRVKLSCKIKRELCNYVRRDVNAELLGVGGKEWIEQRTRERVSRRVCLRGKVRAKGERSVKLLPFC